MTKTVNEYPPHAIQNDETVQNLLNLAKSSDSNVYLFSVGQSGYLITYLLSPETYLAPSELTASLFVRDALYEDSRNTRTDFSLMDANIPFNGYNDHFLFYNEDDAKNYSEFLKNSEEHKTAVAEHHRRCDEMFGGWWDDYYADDEYNVDLHDEPEDENVDELFLALENDKEFIEFVANLLLSHGETARAPVEPEVMTEEMLMEALKDLLPPEESTPKLSFNMETHNPIKFDLEAYVNKGHTFYEELKVRELAPRKIEEINVSIPSLGLEFRQVNVLID